MTSNKKMFLKSYSLSNDDLSDILYDLHGGHCPIIKYPELENIEHVLDILENYGFVIILFMNGSLNYGHWICLTVSPNSNKKNKTNGNKKLPCLNFYDSYGIKPDSQKDYVDDNFLELSDQMKDYLTQLLLTLSKYYNIEYNEKKLQEKKKGVNTCGRHCIIRIINKDLPLDKFQKVLQTGKLTPDQKVVKLTNMLMNGNCTTEDIQDLFKNDDNNNK